MKTILGILVATTLSTVAFADTSYTCTAQTDGANPAQIVVQGSYSKTGAIQFPISVIINGELAEQYKGASGFLSDKVIQLDGNKNGNKLELRHFVVANGTDSKNYLEYSGKVNGAPVVYKTKAVDCAREAN